METYGMILHPGRVPFTNGHDPFEASVVPFLQTGPLVAGHSEDVALVQKLLCFCVNSTVDCEDVGVKVIGLRAGLVALEVAVVLLFTCSRRERTAINALLVNLPAIL